MRLSGDLSAFHQLMRQRSRLVTGSAGVGHDARKRGTGKLAIQGIVIDADDGHFIRNRQAIEAASSEDLLSRGIATPHHTDGLGQLCQPPPQLLHQRFGAPRIAGDIEVETPAGGLAGLLGKMNPALPRPAEPVVAAISQVLETPL